MVNEPAPRETTPKPPASRQEQFVGRRQQIIDAARRLFARHGYHGTSIRDVHREIGVSDGLLYHYFPSKLDMLQAVLAEGFDAIGGRRLAGDIPQGTPGREALLRTGHQLWDRWTRNADLVQILVREHGVLQEAGDYSLPAFFLHATAGLADLLERRMAAGEMRRLDPLLAATHFVYAIVGLYMFHVMLGGDRVLHRTFEDVLVPTVDMIWDGWKA